MIYAHMECRLGQGIALHTSSIYQLDQTTQLEHSSYLRGNELATSSLSCAVNDHLQNSFIFPLRYLLD